MVPYPPSYTYVPLPSENLCVEGLPQEMESMTNARRFSAGSSGVEMRGRRTCEPFFTFDTVACDESTMEGNKIL